MSIPILLFLPQTTYCFDMVKGVADYARMHETKWNILYSSTYGQELFETLGRSGKVGAAIGFFVDPRVTKVFVRESIPIVNVSARDMALVEKIPSVLMNNRMIGQLAAQHFVDRGYPHLIFFQNEIKSHFMNERQAGFCEEAERRGVRVEVIDKNELFPASYRDKQFLNEDQLFAIRAKLDKYKGIAGIAALEDFECFKLAEFLQQAGYQIPLDFALLGCNNEEHLCMLGNCQRSSIEVNGKTIGYEAAAMMDLLLRKKKPNLSPVVVRPGQVVTRQSSDVLYMNDEVVEKALDYMLANVDQTVRVTDIARAAGVSRRVLEMRFKKFFRQPVAKKMVEIRINKVKALLEDSHLTITLIAELAGFSSSQRLAAVFRKQTGMTLSKYRHGVKKK